MKRMAVITVIAGMAVILLVAACGGNKTSKAGTAGETAVAEAGVEEDAGDEAPASEPEFSAEDSAPEPEHAPLTPDGHFNPDIAYSFFTDPRDNQTYRAVEIGELTWMAQNLNFKTDSSWCYYDIEGNCQWYGRLYDWNTAMEVCPAGWRLPTDGEWSDLVQIADDNVAGDYVAGKKLKSMSGWHSGNGTDDFGFSARPGGFRYAGEEGHGSIGFDGYWWSATEYGAGKAYYRIILMQYTHTIRGNRDKSFRYSVRCVKE